MQRALDFDKTPALGVPLPLFLNVPLFALLAGALATWAGPQTLISRWSGTTLALTHLWTLGILGSAMLGALMQILAVACNVAITPSRLIASFVHVALTAGTLFLAAGFLWRWPAAWRTAALLLGLAFAVYLLAVFRALWTHRRDAYEGAREILVPIRGALLALGVTVAIGCVLASTLGLGLTPPDWVDAHVLWGLLGWAGLLVIGMSFQLLPIFQATELYPRQFTRWLPLWVPVLLLAWTGLSAATNSSTPRRGIAELLLAGSYALWAGLTLQRLWSRKHPKPEPATLFWYLSMSSLLACVLLWMRFAIRPTDPIELALGTLFIVGVLGSAVNGMLYKIVPFLLWKHAQDAIAVPDGHLMQARRLAKTLPKMASYIPEPYARAQWAAHSLVVISWTLAALNWTPARLVAGPLLLLSAAGLSCNFAQALYRYRRALRLLAATTTPTAST